MTSRLQRGDRRFNSGLAHFAFSWDFFQDYRNQQVALTIPHDVRFYPVEHIVFDLNNPCFLSLACDNKFVLVQVDIIKFAAIEFTYTHASVNMEKDKLFKTCKFYDNF